MKVVAIIQSRTGSTRLPRKALARIGRRTITEHVIARVQAAKLVDEVWLAVPHYDRKLAKLAIKRGCKAYVHSGKEADVLGRYYQCAIRAEATWVVRVTGDCCLIDPTVIDACVKLALQEPQAKYCSNVWPESERTYPDGLDVEVFHIGMLQAAQFYVKDCELQMREHVCGYFHLHAGDGIKTLKQADDDSRHRWVVDTPADLEWMRSIHKRLKFSGVHPTHGELMGLLYANPKLRRVT